MPYPITPLIEFELAYLKAKMDAGETNFWPELNLDLEIACKRTRAVRIAKMHYVTHNFLKTATARKNVQEIERFKNFMPFFKECGQLNLHDAVRNSDVQTVENLLRQGFPFNLVTESGFTPLYYTCQQSYIRNNDAALKILELLLKQNELTPTFTDDDFEFAAAHLCKIYDWEDKSEDHSINLLKLLIKGGAKKAALDAALNATCQHGSRIKIVTFLLEQGADLTQIDSNNNSILHKATRNPWKSEELISLLLVKAKESNLKDWINLKNSEGNTALHYACGKKNNELVIAELLESGADPNAINLKGEKPDEFSPIGNEDVDVSTISEGVGYYAIYGKGVKLIRDEQALLEKIKKLKETALNDLTKTDDMVHELEKLHLTNHPVASKAFMEAAEFHVRNCAALLKNNIKDPQTSLVALQRLARLKVPGAQTAYDEYCQEKTLILLSEAHKKNANALLELNDLAKKNYIPIAQLRLHQYYEYQADQLCNEALKGDNKAYAQLEELVKTDSIGLVYLGKYYLELFKKQVSKAASSSVIHFFKPISKVFFDYETKAQIYLEKALGENLVDAYFFMAELHQLKGKEILALKNYFESLRFRASNYSSAIINIKGLSHSQHPHVAVAANLYQWLVNHTNDLLVKAFTDSPEESARFILENISNNELKAALRFEMALTILKYRVPVELEFKIYDAILKFMTQPLLDPIVMAAELHSVLIQFSFPRFKIVSSCCLAPKEYPELLRAALLQYEMKEIHNPDETTILQNLWNTISNSTKDELSKKMDLTQPVKQEVAASTSSSSSSSTSLDDRTVNDIRFAVNQQIDQVKKYSKDLSTTSKFINYLIKLCRNEELLLTEIAARDSVIRAIPEEEETLLIETFIQSPHQMKQGCIDPKLQNKEAKSILLAELELNLKEVTAKLNVNKENDDGDNLAEQMPNVPQVELVNENQNKAEPANERVMLTS